MKIITVTVLKGGVAKTTTAAILAQAGAFRGRRVLAIDLDSQGNLSQALGVRANNGRQNSYRLLTGEVPARETIVHSAQGMDVIPASQHLLTVTSGRGSARRLRQALEPIRNDYDICFIDTPTAGELQYNALMASNGVVIPIQTDSYNIQSLYQIADIVRQIQKSNPALEIEGTVITRYEGGTNIAKQLRAAIEANGAELGIPALGAIRKGIAVVEAAGLQKSLYQYDKRSNPAADYLAVYDRLDIEK